MFRIRYILKQVFSGVMVFFLLRNPMANNISINISQCVSAIGSEKQGQQKY